jgi:nucleoid DNA-binding protein
VLFTFQAIHEERLAPPIRYAGEPHVTKKEIVKQISERIGLTQLKTKEIVQQTFDAIVDTLLEVGRIELRNFGVFEVKQRKARKARNPRTGDKVDVPPKNVVTFKPGKEMEERVRKMENVPQMTEAEETEAEPVGVVDGNGTVPGTHEDPLSKAKAKKPV